MIQAISYGERVVRGDHGPEDGRAHARGRSYCNGDSFVVRILRGNSKATTSCELPEIWPMIFGPLNSFTHLRWSWRTQWLRGAGARGARVGGAGKAAVRRGTAAGRGAGRPRGTARGAGPLEAGPAAAARPRGGGAAAAWARLYVRGPRALLCWLPAAVALLWRCVYALLRGRGPRGRRGP